MSRVDFYIVESTDPRSRLLIACRLCEKAWLGGFRTFVLTDTSAQQKQIDDLLWTFRPGSFVPHATEHDPAHADVPVIVGNSLNPERSSNLLVNLKSTTVDPLPSVERIIEIVDRDTRVREEGRKRFRHYRENGHSVKSHRISL